MEVKGHFDIDFIRAPCGTAGNLEKHTGDTFRECRPAIWNGARDPEGCQLPYSATFISISDRTVRCRENLFVAPVVALKPTRGLINIFGKDVARLDHKEVPLLRRRIGIVFQDFRLLDHMTTYENVALPLRVRGKEEATYRHEVEELLHWVGLGDRMNVLPPVLSGGEKQRAAIARALIDQPELLLADEPTGNVDPPLAKRLLRLFTELNRSGTAVIIATHDLSLMDQVNARRMILEHGRLDIYD
jgi:cell division transport system ATP-binding protein